MKKTLKTVGINAWNWVKKHPRITFEIVVVVMFIFSIIYAFSNMMIVN